MQKAQQKVVGKRLCGRASLNNNAAGRPNFSSKRSHIKHQLHQQQNSEQSQQQQNNLLSGETVQDENNTTISDNKSVAANSSSAADQLGDSVQTQQTQQQQVSSSSSKETTSSTPSQQQQQQEVRQSAMVGEQDYPSSEQHEKEKEKEKETEEQRYIKTVDWKKYETWSDKKRNFNFAQRRLSKKQKQQPQQHLESRQQQQRHHNDTSSSVPSTSPQSNSQTSIPGSASQQHINSNSSNVCEVNMAQQSLASSSVSGLHQQQQLNVASSSGNESNSLHSVQSKVASVVEEQLRQESENFVENDGSSGNAKSGSLHQSSVSGNGVVSNQTSSTSNSGVSSETLLSGNGTEEHQTVVLLVSRVQDGGKMGRHLETEEKQLHPQPSNVAGKRNSNSLGNGNQNQSFPSLQGNGLHGGAGNSLSLGDSNLQKSDEETQQGGSSVSKEHQPNVVLDQAGSGNQASHLSLVQEGSSRQAGSTRSGGQGGTKTDPASSQTSRSAKSISGINNSLHLQQSSACQNDENAGSNTTPLAVENSSSNNNKLQGIQVQNNNNNISSQSPSTDENSNNKKFSKEIQSTKNKKETKEKDWEAFAAHTELLEKYDVLSPEVLLQRQILHKIDEYDTGIINANIADPNASSKHSFVRHSHSSKLPTLEEKSSVRLHSRPVEPLNKKNIKSLMNEKTLKRVEELEGYAFEGYNKICEQNLQKAINNNNKYNVPGSDRSSSFLKAHAEQLEKDGIISKVQLDNNNNNKYSGQKYGDTLALCDLFTVIENDSDGSQRQRVICWTRKLNSYLSTIYKPDMKQLKHQSFYVDAVRDECAAFGDLAISYYQVEIPKASRRIYRFLDEEGNLYEFNRLPMGLSPSAEILQLYTETLALLPTRVKPQEITLQSGEKVQTNLSGVVGKVWIDGFQHTGSANSVAYAAEKIRKVSEFCGVTWKKQKAYNNEEIVISKEYDFIGIHFDHNKHQVSVARKTLDKLPAPYKAGGEYEVTQLEKDISRLLFCTGALRIMSATFYFALKWVNRHVARLNKPDADLNQKVVLPKHVASLLNVWICKSKLFVHLPPSNVIVKPTRYDVLFTDASAYGWGAIFIGADGDIAITGGKWDKRYTSQEASRLMSVLEAQALNQGLLAFKERLRQNKNVELRVDNTSVQHAMAKGKAKNSIALNEEIKQPLQWLYDEDFLFTISYVNTKENFADAPSRGNFDLSISTRTAVTKAVANLNRGSVGMTGRNKNQVISTVQKQIG